jgi:hypothetical protein
MQLAKFVMRLNDFVVTRRDGAGYDHMGAIICDSILQAGLNYRSVVAPRIKELLLRWPSGRRTSVFASMTKRYGIRDVLNWRDKEKPHRISALTDFFLRRSIETESELAEWLLDSSHASSLIDVRGVGPKTIDYIKSLVGVQTVAVERQVRTFVSWAGLSLNSYNEIRSVVCDAARLLGHDSCDLDHAIWKYVSTRHMATMNRRTSTAA